MTIQLQHPLGKEAEFRLSCDNCGAETGWIDAHRMSVEQLEKAARMHSQEYQGAKVHVCDGCFRGVSTEPNVLMALVALDGPVPMASPTISGQTDWADKKYVDAATRVAGIVVSSQDAGPNRLFRRTFAITGALSKNRDKIINLIVVLGGTYTKNAVQADVLIVGDTGIHGTTRKMKSFGGQTWKQERFWRNVELANAGSDIIDTEYTVKKVDDGVVPFLPKKEIPLLAPPKEDLEEQFRRSRDAMDALNKVLG